MRFKKKGSRFVFRRVDRVLLVCLYPTTRYTFSQIHLSYWKHSFHFGKVTLSCLPRAISVTRKWETASWFVKLPSGTSTKSLVKWSPSTALPAPRTRSTVLLHGHTLQSCCSQVPGRVERSSKLGVRGELGRPPVQWLWPEWRLTSPSEVSKYPRNHACACSASSNIIIPYNLQWPSLSLKSCLETKLQGILPGRAGWMGISS